jgi:hypothetical protein
MAKFLEIPAQQQGAKMPQAIAARLKRIIGR